MRVAILAPHSDSGLRGNDSHARRKMRLLTQAGVDAQLFPLCQGANASSDALRNFNPDLILALHGSR